MVFPNCRAIIVVDLKSLFAIVCYHLMFLIQELKEGRQIGRAELYIATHTRKNGQPIDDYSFEKIVCCFLFSSSYWFISLLMVENFIWS
jgi:hypothetical protein